MEILKISIPAKKHYPVEVRIQNGVVSSGDMEVLYRSDDLEELRVTVKSSIDNSHKRWQALLERIAGFNEIPAGEMLIHDFGASPGVARLRIEQTLDEASHA